MSKVTVTEALRMLDKEILVALCEKMLNMHSKHNQNELIKELLQLSKKYPNKK